jgi:Transglycosylase SLT domain
LPKPDLPEMPKPTLSPRRLSLIVAACCIACGGPMRIGAYAEPSGASFNACEQAGVAAEQAGGLPSGLLLAIGRIESGRWDTARGRVIPWPWTINAAGKGQWFETKELAASSVKSQLDGGTRSIDVGCFQISLMYHPAAFASLEQAFDPDANAAYAARFLLSLYSRTGSWEAAVEAYHSADPALGFAYREQVFASWLGAAPINMAAAIPVAAPARVRTPPTIPLVIAGVQIWTPMPAGSGATTVAMPGSPETDPGQAQSTAPLPVVSYRVMPHR